MIQELREKHLKQKYLPASPMSASPQNQPSQSENEEHKNEVDSVDFHPENVSEGYGALSYDEWQK